eukprot:4360553-Pleurochrysis_carterae.AAC.1
MLETRPGVSKWARKGRGSTPTSPYSLHLLIDRSRAIYWTCQHEGERNSKPWSKSASACSKFSPK